jgi:hypothetical protein
MMKPAEVAFTREDQNLDISISFRDALLHRHLHHKHLADKVNCPFPSISALDCPLRLDQVQRLAQPIQQKKLAGPTKRQRTSHWLGQTFWLAQP